MTTVSQSGVSSHLADKFANIFPGGKRENLLMFRAPGRVNLIGEHTDYNNGFVMPAAIDFDVRVACEPNHSGKLAIYSMQESETAWLELAQERPEPRRHWSDYIRGVQLQLSSEGVRLSGANLLIDGHVPMGAGLSSSAALEVGVALALLESTDTYMDGSRLALLCQRAENEFVGARCGIMDQFASANSRAGKAMLLDCRSLQATYASVPSEVAIIICNTMVKHSLATGEYNQRRHDCEDSVRYLQKFLPQVTSLRDVTEDDLRRSGDGLSAIQRRRCKHVIAENARVLQAGYALDEGDLKAFGQLMYASHASLRDDYEVSCPELDLMVKLAEQFPGTYGSRMTGGGFGGCTVNLVEKGVSASFVTRISAAYQAKIGICPDIYVTTAATGAGRIA